MQLTNGASKDIDAGSPDGSSILFASELDGVLQIFVMGAGRANGWRLTRDRSNKRNP